MGDSPEDAAVTAARAVCDSYGVTPCPVQDREKVGIARNVLDGVYPINGLRMVPEGDTCGWYLWAGEELPDDPDFFVPLHVAHLTTWCPEALPYLSLPPGWRFLIAPGYEDIWEDQDLLNNR